MQRPSSLGGNTAEIRTCWQTLLKGSVIHCGVFSVPIRRKSTRWFRSPWEAFSLKPSTPGVLSHQVASSRGFPGRWRGAQGLLGWELDCGQESDLTFPRGCSSPHPLTVSLGTSAHRAVLCSGNATPHASQLSVTLPGGGGHWRIRGSTTHHRAVPLSPSSFVTIPSPVPCPPGPPILATQATQPVTQILVTLE